MRMIMIHFLVKVFKEVTLFAKFILFHVSFPVAGILFCSLENKFILKNIMNGGFFDKTKLPDSYLNSLCTSLKKKAICLSF
jgi:hypothetical protein